MFSTGSRGWIGIDLGTRVIKLAQVERAGAQLRLVHGRILRREPASESSSGEDAIAWWTAELESRDLRAGFLGNRVACVFPSSVAEVRAVSLPDGSEAERRAMAANELEAMYSGVAGRRVFDFWDSRPPVGEGESKLENVNVLSVVEDHASAIFRSLTKAGLQCEAIDGIPLTLARALELQSSENTTAPQAVIDWGATSATFCVICQRRPVFTRQLRDCGFASIPAAASEALGLSLGDAEQLLSTYGVPNPQRQDDAFRDVQEVLGDVVAPAVAALIAEIRKTLSYPELHRSRLIPERIWLFGGGASVRNMGAYLSARAGVTIRTWLPLLWETSSLSVPLELLGPAIALSAIGLTR